MDRIFRFESPASSNNPPNCSYQLVFRTRSERTAVNSPLLLIIQQWYEFMSVLFIFLYLWNIFAPSHCPGRWSLRWKLWQKQELCKTHENRSLTRLAGREPSVEKRKPWEAAPLTVIERHCPDRLCRCLRDIKGVSIGVYFRIGNKSSIAVRGSWPCKLSVFLAFVPESCVRFVRIVMKEAENRINRAF